MREHSGRVGRLIMIQTGSRVRIGRIEATVVARRDGLIKCYLDPDDASQGTFWLPESDPAVEVIED